MIIDNVISAQGHGREVVNKLNATEERFIFHSMETMKLIASQRFDARIKISTPTHKSDVSLA